MPILTASTMMSSLIASSCAGEEIDAGGLNTPRTPRVFCAVSDAIAAMP